MGGAGGEDEDNGQGHGQGHRQIPRLQWGLTLDFIFCVLLGMGLLGWKIFLLGFDVLNILLVTPYIACVVIWLFSGMPDKMKVANDTTSGSSFWSRTGEALLVTFYCRKFLRLQKLWKATAGEEEQLWKCLLSQCYEDRIVYSVRGFGFAIVAIWIRMTTGADSGLEICSWDDLSTLLIIIWSLLTTSAADASYEIRYHEKNSRDNHYYSGPGPGERVFLILAHIFRLCWILQCMAFYTLLKPWIVPILLGVFFLWNIISHLMLQTYLRCSSSTVSESPHLNEILSPEHFLLTSSTTLPYSLGTVESNGIGKVCLVMKDLLPMLCGQMVLSYLSAYTEDHTVREMPYFCRIDDEPNSMPVAFKSGEINRRAPTIFLDEDEANSPYYVPSPFSKYDIVGVVIVFIYAALLLVYCLYVHLLKFTRKAVARASMTGNCSGNCLIGNTSANCLIGNSSASCLRSCDGSSCEASRQAVNGSVVLCQNNVLSSKRAAEFRI